MRNCTKNHLITNVKIDLQHEYEIQLWTNTIIICSSSFDQMGGITEYILYCSTTAVLFQWTSLIPDTPWRNPSVTVHIVNRCMQKTGINNMLSIGESNTLLCAHPHASRPTDLFPPYTSSPPDTHPCPYTKIEHTHDHQTTYALTKAYSLINP